MTSTVYWRTLLGRKRT